MSTECPDLKANQKRKCALCKLGFIVIETVPAEIRQKYVKSAY